MRECVAECRGEVAVARAAEIGPFELRDVGQFGAGLQAQHRVQRILENRGRTRCWFVGVTDYLQMAARARCRVGFEIVTVAVVTPHVEQFGFDEKLVTEGVERGNDVLADMPAPVVVVRAGA